MRDIIKRLPKLRGRGKSAFKSFQPKPAVVNVELLQKHFAAGETVSPATLSEKGLVHFRMGARPLVKILAQGELAKRLTITGCALSAGAKAKIEGAGGKIL